MIFAASKSLDFLHFLHCWFIFVIDSFYKAFRNFLKVIGHEGRHISSIHWLKQRICIGRGGGFESYFTIRMVIVKVWMMAWFRVQNCYGLKQRMNKVNIPWPLERIDKKMNLHTFGRSPKLYNWIAKCLEGSHWWSPWFVLNSKHNKQATV